jgi:hypothetical protein
MRVLRSAAAGLALALVQATPSSAYDPYFNDPTNGYSHGNGPAVFAYVAAPPIYDTPEDSTLVYTYSEIRVVRRQPPQYGVGYAYLPPLEGRVAPFYAYGPGPYALESGREIYYWSQPRRSFAPAPAYGPPLLGFSAPVTLGNCATFRFWNGRRCIDARHTRYRTPPGYWGK